MPDVPESMVVTEQHLELPIIELLTGRGFVTGKSGSGKSNTASVIAEELLEYQLPLMIVDTDGEYFGLQDRYEILHATVDDTGDMAVGPDDADRLAELALEGNVPVVLDTSGYVDPDESAALIRPVLREVFRLEDTRRQPFLLIVEEIHEYLPEQGAHGQLGDLLIQIAKRGRKRGIGLCGISQRPAAVDKDFITQCDWLVWHRLTWENDTRVVRKLLGKDVAGQIDGLDDGEGFLMTDWDDQVRRVRFKRKRTLDAGATPDLSAVAGGPGDAIDPAVADAIATDDEADPDAALERKQRRIEQLERQVKELESKLEHRQEAEADPPVERADGGVDAGPVAEGLTELGSLAAHTARSTYRRLAIGMQSLADRMRTRW